MSTLQVTTIQSNSTTAPPVIQNSAGTEYGTFCRAWVNFNGTFATSPFTVANGGIRGAFNVSSVTDNGTGAYAVNFTNSLADGNYTAVAGCSPSNTANLVASVFTSSSGTSAAGTSSSFSIYLYQRGTGNPDDSSYVTASIFR